MGFSQAPSLVSEGFFEFGFKLEEIGTIFGWLSTILYSGELILPVLFNMESCDSSHHSQRGVTHIWIFCRNSGLLFNTGRRYSPYSLIWRVTIPRIVYSGQSLTTVGSLLTLKQKIDNACRALFIRNISNNQKYGLPKAQFLTPHCPWKQGVDF